MSQSRTRFIGMDIHKDSMAVAYVPQDHGAEVPFLGAIGTRQCALDQLIRKMHSKAKHLIVVSEAGPCGSWLSRSLSKRDDDCWVVAPSLISQKPGDRVNTDRRALVEGARVSRSPAKGSRHLQRRLETQPKVIQDIGWKAQVRLCQRFRRLVARGKHPNVVTVAMARELAGFMWAMATQVPSTRILVPR